MNTIRMKCIIKLLIASSKNEQIFFADWIFYLECQNIHLLFHEEINQNLSPLRLTYLIKEGLNQKSIFDFFISTLACGTA